MDEEVAQWDQDSRETETTLKSEWIARPTRRWELSWGGSIKRVDLDLSTVSDPESLIMNDSIPFVHRIDVSENLRSWKEAAYVASSYDLAEWLTAEGGARFDRFDYTGRRKLGPRASLSVRLHPSTTLNLA